MKSVSEKLYFEYPPNLRTLDLATVVSLYRSRGEPRKADLQPIACSVTKKVLRSYKFWFGLHYSQEIWDKMLTNGCEGYPLTEIELNILGLYLSPPTKDLTRDFVEKNCGILPQMAYMILNDLKQFGFLEETGVENLIISDRGIKALDGISYRIFDKKFTPDLLYYHKETSAMQGKNPSSQSQIPLF